MYRGVSIDAKTMYVPIIVSGTQVLAVIDSGAQVSIMSKKLYDQLQQKPRKDDTVFIKGIGTSRIQGNIVNQVPIEIGKTQLEWNMLMADIPDIVILGLDFLEGNKIIIDHGTYQLTMNEETIPVTSMREEQHDVTIYRIKIAETTIIPPNSSCYIEASLDQKPKGDIVIQPYRYNGDILSPNGIHLADKDTFLLVRNPTDKAVTLRKNQPFGIGIEAEDVIPEDQTELHDFGLQSICRRSDNGQTEIQLPEHLQELYERSTQKLNDNESHRVAELLSEFQDIFSKGDLDIGLFNGNIKHRINTGDTKPIKQRLRRTPLHFEKEEEEHLKQMLAKNVIQESNSEWAATPVLVRKKDKSLRYCVDYRKLNKATVKDAFPLPNIETCIDTLGGNLFMSTLDMAAGYWQLEIDERDRHKTAFITKFGLFEHVKLAFGLCNSPATFSRVMQLVLKGLSWRECLAYLDDVIVLGKTFDDHIGNLTKVLARFRRYNLKLKPKKCCLFQNEVKFLGKIVSAQGIRVNPENIETIRKWTIPQSKKDVESFLGFMNYHREHIPKYAEVALPLHELVRPKKQFVWEEKHQLVFEKMKSSLIEATILNYPNSSDTFILDTDASNNTIGAELSQLQDGKEVAISFASRVLTPAQRKYCTTRKELLAIVTFTRQYRHYLLGRPFVIRTDHNSLIWLLNFKNIEGQLARWIEELAQYDMLIQHRPGKFHGNADGLSRMADPLATCPEYQPLITLKQLPCGGCKFCTRARSQWETFENDVDYVQPISVRRLSETATNWVDTLSTEEICAEQEKDHDLKKVICWLKSEDEPEDIDLQLSSPAVRHYWMNRSQLEICDGVLYYRWEDPVSPRLLLIAPDSLKTQVLTLCHNIPLSGHMGQSKTLAKVKHFVMWYGMSTDCKLFVRACSTCNKNKKTKDKPRARLGQYHAGIPLERVHMDILGPLPISKRGNKYVLMVIDQFTKWLECYPIPNQGAEIVAKTLVDNFISRFGCPLELHTDQGRNMDGNMIRQLCKILQITKTRTTPYHPASNGQIERYNSLILQTIRCFLKKQQNKWDDQIQLLTGAIRATPNRQTGFSANLLMFGREVTHPLDLTLGLQTVNQQEKEIVEYVQDLVLSLALVHDIARDNLKTSQTTQKKYYDLRKREKVYHVGDAVYKLDTATKPGQSRKLKPPWKGPYIVTKVYSTVLYEIEDRKRSWTIHHDRLYICKDGELPIWIQRRREQLCSQQESDVSVPDEDIVDLSSLFMENSTTTSNAPMSLQHTSDTPMFRHQTSDSPMFRHHTSDTPMSRHHTSDSPMSRHHTSDGPMLRYGDELASDVPIPRHNRERDRNVIRDFQSLDEIADLDQTLIYNIEEADEAEKTPGHPKDMRERRRRRRPVYLQDFID